jgi:bifunctional DNA-binding transcriptional regulator/antitoxin component of YhaV-PrlF toxin-antitoxin module
MSSAATGSVVGKKGTVVIAPRLRKEFGLEEGARFVQETTPEGVLIRPSGAAPLRRYRRQEKAAFLLRSALTREEYDEALEECRKLGVDVKKIPHRAPR